MNGDGRLDVVFGDEVGGGAWIFLNAGGSAVEGRAPADAEPADAEPAGIEPAGFAPRGLAFADPARIDTPAGIVDALAIADLTGDGKLDLVIGLRGAPSAVLVNDGSGRAFDVRRFGDGAGAVYGFAVGDVDGDGRPDIVAARSDAPSMLYFNSGR